MTDAYAYVDSHIERWKERKEKDGKVTYTRSAVNLSVAARRKIRVQKITTTEVPKKKMQNSIERKLISEINIFFAKKREKKKENTTLKTLYVFLFSLFSPKE